jgi:uncharacterized protein (DUF1501 family)
MVSSNLNRRLFMKAGLAGACSIAAHPLMSTVTFAASNGGRPLGDKRMIVVILRGAMDGLDLLRPFGDANLADYRPNIIKGDKGFDLDGFFWLNPAMSDLMPLWSKGQLGFVHAASTPYRDRRSHFDGQDILEAGTGLDVPAPEIRDGWLNRMLQAVPGITAETAYSVGNSEMPVLKGAAPFAAWAPEQSLDLSAASKLLLEQVYESDPLFHSASAQAIELSQHLSEAESMGKKPTGPFGDDLALADFTADRLREETRIASFSISGWDTHRGQAGAISKPLQRLSQVILRLQSGLGEIWGNTLLIAMTEFGRTARENGTQGTDHGTGGAMVLAGGALTGGRVMGDWPGLSEDALFERRDLMPTTDVRAWAGQALRGMYGFDKGLIENTIFPGLILPRDPGLLL